jgi:hypothetical protein
LYGLRRQAELQKSQAEIQRSQAEIQEAQRDNEEAHQGFEEKFNALIEAQLRTDAKIDKLVALWLKRPPNGKSSR